MDHDSLIAVAEDLEYLASWDPEISDAEIRRGSSVLRRLLVEDAYGTAWRAVGFTKQPSLVAVSLEALTQDVSSSRIVFALAAGAEFRGIHIAGMLFHEGDRPPQEPISIRPDGYPGEANFTLSEFLGSTSGIVQGRTFNRREVIKYMANVKGGVHLSTQQRKAEEKLVARLGKIEKKMMVHTTDGLLVETLAIGQAVGRSRDARLYVAKARGV